MLLSLIVSSRFRVGVVETGGRGKDEGIADNDVDLSRRPYTFVTRGEDDGGLTGLSMGDATNGIESGLCLSEEMGFAFGVEVII